MNLSSFAISGRTFLKIIPLICDEALPVMTKINHNYLDLFDDVSKIDHFI